MPSSRESAVYLARKGFRVFRTNSTTLRPTKKGWTADASADEARVAADFTDATGDSVADNVAILTGDSLLVVDVDVKDGPHALESLAALEAAGLPRETFTVKTPSGGLHLFYEVDPTYAFPNDVEWRPGIDLRGHHGYVNAPGSIKPNGGAYEVLLDAPIARFPAQFEEELRRPRKTLGDISAAVTGDYEDAWSIAKAVEYLRTAEPDAGPGKRHDPLIRMAHVLFDLGVTPQTAAQLIEEHWPEAINVTEDIAYQVGALAEGRVRDGKVWGVDHPRRIPSVYQTFERVTLARLEDEGPRHPDGGASLKPTPVVAPSLKRIPRRPWIVQDYIAREIVTALIAPGGIGKTQWTASLAIAVATGRGDILDLPIRERTKVWIWNQEDEADELARRTAAVLQHFKVADDELLDPDGKPCLFVNSGVDEPMMLAKRGQNGALFVAPDVGKMVAHVRDNGIGLVVLDPIVEMHEGEENDNAQMRLVWSAARAIAVRAHCAVIVAAHSRKPDKASSDGYAGDNDSLRGASSQGGVVRASFTLLNMSASDAKALRVKEEDRRLYVRLDNAKANRSFVLGGPRWLKRTSVDIEAGFPGSEPEYVGVLTPVAFESRVKVETAEPEVAPDAEIVAAIVSTLAGGAFSGDFHRMNDVMRAMAPETLARMPSETNRVRTINSILADKDAPFIKGRASITVAGGSLLVARAGAGAPLKFKFVPDKSSPDAKLVEVKKLTSLPDELSNSASDINSLL